MFLSFLIRKQQRNMERKMNYKLATTRYIANRAFGESRKFGGYLKHRQIVDLALRMKKNKNKNTVQRWRLE